MKAPQDCFLDKEERAEHRARDCVEGAAEPWFCGTDQPGFAVSAFPLFEKTPAASKMM